MKRKILQRILTKKIRTFGMNKIKAYYLMIRSKTII